MKSITIIGMGLSGNASFCQLISHMLTTESLSEFEITIHVFEAQKENFATGVPYRVNAPNIWTLNNPAKDFKFTPGLQPLNDWIAENLANLRIQFPDMNEEYCPRAVVGHYLKAQYTNHKNKAELHGIKVVEHFEEVLDFDVFGANKWAIKTQTLEIESDFLFLCFGHIPAHHYHHLESKPGYYTIATPLPAFDDIPSDNTIHILGGQASFVDYALWLAVAKNHNGTLISLTRNPPIITTKGNPDTCDMAPLDSLKQTLIKQTPRTLAFSSARDSFWETYKVAAQDPIDPMKQPSTSTALSYQLTKYEKHTVSTASDRCGNIDELRAFIKYFYFNGAYEAFWKALTDEGKESFIKLMYTQIMAYLTGITPVNARLLLELYNNERVKEKSGLTSIDYDEEYQEFLLHFKTGETEKAKYLIDTSGYSYWINHVTDLPLIHRAVAKGLLVPKRHGGIEMNDAGQPINLYGDVQRSLFCVGPVASFGDKYPTPHASFLVFYASDKAVISLTEQLRSSANQSFSYY